MAVSVEVLPTKPGDAEILAARMRAPDLAEIHAASGQPPLKVIQAAIAATDQPMTAFFDGELACIFGVAPLNFLAGQGAPWMLGSNQIDRHPGVFIKRCGDYIAEMASSYQHLLNYVDARNTRSIRWLKRMGFNFHDAVPYGVAQLPFHLFEMRSPLCANP